MIRQRFPIGLIFTLKRGKQTPHNHTIVDVLKTYNAKGELVKLEYVTEYPFMGQTVTYNCVDATIAKCLPSEALEQYKEASY